MGGLHSEIRYGYVGPEPGRRTLHRTQPLLSRHRKAPSGHLRYAARDSALHRIETLAKADCLQFAGWSPAMRPPWYANPTYRGCIIRWAVGDEYWTVGTIKQRDAANPNYMSMLYSSPY